MRPRAASHRVAVAVILAAAAFGIAAVPTFLVGYPRALSAAVLVGPALVAAGTLVRPRRARPLAVLLIVAGTVWISVGLAPAFPDPFEPALERAALVPHALVAGCVGAIPTGSLRRRTERLALGLALVIAVAGGVGLLPFALTWIGACVLLTLSRREDAATTASKIAWAAALIAVDLGQLSGLLAAPLAANLVYVIVVAGGLTSVLRLDREREVWAASPTRSDAGVDDYGVRLARALGVADLRVAFLSDGTLLDATGRSVEPVDAAVTIRDDAGEPIAVVSAEVLDAPVSVSALVPMLQRTASIARTRAALRRTAAELRRSRAMLLDVADAERADVDRLVRATVGHHLKIAAARLRSEGLADLAQRSEMTADLVRSSTDRVPAALTVAELLGAIDLPGVDVEVRSDATISQGIAQSLWFFCSEALTNSIKHANANHRTVSAWTTDEALHVAVRDDGDGDADPGGAGMLGLRDRASVLGGSLSVSSRPGGGTEIVIAVPLENGRTTSDRVDFPDAASRTSHLTSRA